MSFVFLDWRLRSCTVHELRYNAEHDGCPVCRDEDASRRLAAVGRGSYAGWKRFPCPFCGGRSIYEGSCSRYRCRKRAGLLPKPLTLRHRCPYCGAQSKYPSACTRHPCRQKAGTVGMYRKPK